MDEDFHPSFGETYTYNGLNELTSYARVNGNSQKYGLDALGNMTSVTTNGQTQTRTSNAQNELTSVSGATTPTYDKNGNLTTDKTGQTYVWDAWNRLVAVKNASGAVIESYSFDALNRRIQETVSGTTTDLYFDGTNIMEERVGGKTNVQEVWNPLATNTLVERDSNPNASGKLTVRLYYQVDANNNVTALVGYIGGSWQVAERYTYLPFGAVTIYNPTWMVVRSISAYANNWLFQGGRFDATTGNAVFGNRIYRPSLGTWIGVDPIGFAGGTANFYQMEGNNAINRTDPNGLWWPKINPEIVKEGSVGFGIDMVGLTISDWLELSDWQKNASTAGLGAIIQGFWFQLRHDIRVEGKIKWENIGSSMVLDYVSDQVVFYVVDNLIDQRDIPPLAKNALKSAAGTAKGFVLSALTPKINAFAKATGPAVCKVAGRGATATARAAGRGAAATASVAGREAAAIARVAGRGVGLGAVAWGATTVIKEAPAAGKTIERVTGSKTAGAATAGTLGAAGGGLVIIGTAAAVGSAVPVVGTAIGAGVGATIALGLYFWG